MRLLMVQPWERKFTRGTMLAPAKAAPGAARADQHKSGLRTAISGYTWDGSDCESPIAPSSPRRKDSTVIGW